IQLLHQTTMEQIPQNDLNSALSHVQKIIDDGDQSVAITLKCLDVLEILGKSGKTEVLLPSYSSTVKCLVKATQSKKRLIRQKAAVVRNLWELTVA
uniref:Uncharacterized protein n=1 Tax=Panagrolaimus sp. JU765 TaxID=591449 RepID=A0AC34RDH7_9BILA